jgi:hypothetical protein
MVVPTKISDSTLQYASKFRSKCRIPTLAYLHWANFVRIRPEEVEKNTNTDFDTTLDEPTRRDKGADMGVLFPDPKNVRMTAER